MPKLEATNNLKRQTLKLFGIYFSKVFDNLKILHNYFIMTHLEQMLKNYYNNARSGKYWSNILISNLENVEVIF